jgi:hypothetical protein
MFLKAIQGRRLKGKVSCFTLHYYYHVILVLISKKQGGGGGNSGNTVADQVYWMSLFYQSWKWRKRRFWRWIFRWRIWAEAVDSEDLAVEAFGVVPAEAGKRLLYNHKKAAICSFFVIIFLSTKPIVTWINRLLIKENLTFHSIVLL